MHALDCRHAALCWILCPLPFLRAMADSADRATVWSTAFRSSFDQGQEAQEVATERLRQPLASAVQVRTLLPEHCVAPACEQVLLQATQADPLQYFPEPHEVA